MSNDPTTDHQTELTFYPTVRQGYRPAAEFEAGGTAVSDPSELSITLDVTGHGPDGETERTEAGVDLHVYGPGDVVGIDPSQVIRTDPTPETTDFPPNYFPFVEFDRADLPWLFSPTRADSEGRNRPWCCLVAVDKHADGVDLQQGGTGPLPILTAPIDELPDLAELWAWAHVQALGGRRAEDAERDLFVGRSDETLSRLVCPRNLRESRTYIAAVVPTYEPGRLAGLGEDPFPGAGAGGSGDEGSEGSGEGAGAGPAAEIGPAWRSTDTQVRLPVYYQWEFATGPEGDFEQLVRLLTPRDLGPEIGTRTIDTSDPGPPTLRYGADHQGATVGMGGALRSADVAPDSDPYGADDGTESGAEATLRDVVNQPERVIEALGLPAVGPPKYGQWPADRLIVPGSDGTTPAEFPRWFHELNVSPQHRTAAGFGTQVVQDKQEEFVARAWDQFGDIVGANDRLRVTQLADDTLRRTFDPLTRADLGDLLRLTGPMLGFSDGLTGSTVLQELGQSGVPPSLTTPAFRRFTRPSGPLARRSGVSFDQGTFVEQFVDADLGAAAAAGDAALPGSEAVDSLDVDFGAVVGERVSASDVAGTAAFADYGRSFGEIAPMEGLTDGGEPSETDETPLVSQWRVRPNGEVMSVEAAIRFHERNPEADPNGRVVAQAVDAVRTLEAAAVDAQESMTAARVRLAGESDDSAALAPLDASLEALDDEAIGRVESALTALAARPGTPGDPTLDTETVESALAELRGHREQLSKAVGEERSGDMATRLRTADRPLSRVVETLNGLRGFVEGGPSAATGAVIEPSVAPFPPMRPGAIDHVLSSPVPRVVTDTAIREGSDRAAGDAVDVRAMRRPLLSALDPTVALRMQLSAVTGISPEALATRPEPLDEVMAHPRYYEPMYEALRDLDQEYLLPGADGIPKNTVGAVVTNPPFVEAFMAGLNHEQSRELRWRRFPTDRRGTYFRHFWDRRGDPDSAGDPDARADITPMHQWGTTRLGTHRARPRHADSNGADPTLGSVVLLVRGDLFDRYPNTHVYAAKAVNSGPAGSDGAGDDTDRVPYMPGREETPAPTEFVGDSPHLYPDFRGTLDPDVTFFGFDLSVEQAVNDPYREGEEPDPDGPDAEGWFFVIEEPPGEMHFGLDEAAPEDVGTRPFGITYGPEGSRQTHQVPANEDVDAVEKGWSGLSWGHLVTEGDPEATRFVPIGSGPPADERWSVVAGHAYHSDADGSRAWDPADAATWGTNSAHMARITMQKPVRVSIHADDLLPDEEDQ